MKHFFRGVLIFLALAIAIFAIWQLSLSPRTDRVWAPELARTASADISDSVVVLHNVRDWTYGPGTILTNSWVDSVSIDPSLVTRAWFVFEPFPSLPVAGHTYLTFELSDGRAYSFSVEARKEADEKYSASAGLLRTYELGYTWGTERDFLSRRLLYLGHPVHMYPLQIDADQARTLFVALAGQTNDLAAHPRFYNTLTANCTNLLAEMANKTAPGSVPYDIAWNLPGFSERFLIRIGLIPATGNYDLAPYKDDVAAFAGKDAQIFSQALRLLPPLKNVAASAITPK